MAGKVAAIKFQHTDKARQLGPAGHSRTGACKAQGRCQCPRRRGPKGKR